MESLEYYFKVSPEVIANKYKTVLFTSDSVLQTGVTKYCCTIGEITSDTKYNTATTVVQMSMTEILTSGPNKTSSLTGLTIPILLTQTDIDLGYYSVFDGMISQSEVVNNFIFSSNTNAGYTYFLYNTSDVEYKKYLQLASWTINWGDGTPIQTATTFSPQYYSHTYPLVNGEYTITLRQKTPWGINEVKKTVVVPYTGVTIPNPKGTAYFYPQGGNWSGTAISYNYIFTGDSENNINAQITSSYETVPFIVTGFTSSRVSELAQYGPIKYEVNKPVKGITGTTIINGNVVPTYGIVGVINTITPFYTAYTISDIVYYDYTGNTTIYIVNSSGITSNMIVAEPLTKEEVLLKISDQPQVQSDIYIERGKNSGLERTQRLGEVDNLGDLIEYGYGFFNVTKN